jgi:hypothetical protein
LSAKSKHLAALLIVHRFVEQAEEQLEIREDIFTVLTRIGLQAHRQTGEARVVNQPSKHFDPEVAFADMLVPINARAERLG